MCKKQTSVSHSSTESEVTPLDAGLRLDGPPALDSWDMVRQTTLKDRLDQLQETGAGQETIRAIKTGPKHQLA